MNIGVISKMPSHQTYHSNAYHFEGLLVGDCLSVDLRESSWLAKEERKKFKKSRVQQRSFENRWATRLWR